MVWVAVLGVLVAITGALFVLPIRTYFGQEARLAQRTDQLAQLQAVNHDLRVEVERLRTKDGVREAARTELGFVQAGEIRESILDLPPVPTALPGGWPYSLITQIVELRTNGPASVAVSTAPIDSATSTPVP